MFGTTLATELDRRGHRSDVISLAPASGPAPGLDVEVLPALRRAGAARELRRRAAACDVVLGHGSRGLVAATLASAAGGPPFAYRSIGDPSYWASSRGRALRVGLQLRRAAAVTALWPAAAEVIADRYRLEPGRVEVVPNAADPTAFTPATEAVRASARAELDIADEVPVVAYVGALAPEKRVATAIAATNLVPGAVLVVAGSGPEADAIGQRAVADLPGRHRLLGAVADVALVYAAADVVVLTSRTEGQPGVAIEAGLSGLPVVATDVGGLASVVQDGQTGRLVAPDAPPAAIASAIGHTISERATLGAAARAFTERTFSLAIVTDQFEAVLARAAERG